MRTNGTRTSQRERKNTKYSLMLCRPSPAAKWRGGPRAPAVTVPPPGDSRGGELLQPSHTREKTNGDPSRGQSALSPFESAFEFVVGYTILFETRLLWCTCFVGCMLLADQDTETRELTQNHSGVRLYITC